MTFKEKWMFDHPDLSFDADKVGCPSGYGYRKARADRDVCRSGATCDECWNQEMPEKDIFNNFTEVANNARKCGDAIVRMSEALTSIKDSGDRTQFDTGAVRDMREGKGRCDLMPLAVVGNYITADNESSDWVLWCIRKFQETNSTSYLYSAMHHFEQMRWKCPYTMFLDVAKHFEEGAKKYGENNWQKGIPTHCYIDSAVRHYLKWLREDKDEPHDRAFVWNLMCCIWEVDYHKEEVDK